MCGIAGWLDPSQSRTEQERHEIARRMAATIGHRGPDDAGTWSEPEGPTFGHRRLAILDLSQEGHQPMSSASGRFVLSFNGEIYNFRALRATLQAAGYPFRGHSDTEVLVASFDHWGVAAALQQLNGMFAFSVWDREEQLLHLARDRMGEKPLYYGWVNGHFFFGSELKALRAHPDFVPDIDRGAIALFMRHNYVPAPYSIYKGIRKLPPGHHLVVRNRLMSPATPQPYWRAADSLLAPRSSLSAEENTETLQELLLEAVALRMEADVPLGAFLSGGVDSSTVVALMQAQSRQPIKTFTIGFEDPGFNEAEHAKAIAHHLGTDHTELYVTPSEAMETIPRLPRIYDEPFADSSQIPTLLISELARRDVKVTLSGDGGDELFGGYTRYFLGRRIWKNMRWLPRQARLLAAGSAAWIANRDGLPWSRIDQSLPSRIGGRSSRSMFRAAADVLQVRDAKHMYLKLVSHWRDPALVVISATEPPTPLTGDPAWELRDRDLAEKMMYLDGISYLPDDILTKVDRASMAVSLEARVPLLDHHVVDFAWRLPMEMKMGATQGKIALREVLYRYVPQRLIERPKMGFGVPIGAWLRGPLRAWAEDLLNEDRLRRDGIFVSDEVTRKWREHLSGSHDWDYHLWDVLMFQSWLDEHHPNHVDVV